MDNLAFYSFTGATSKAGVTAGTTSTVSITPTPAPLSYVIRGKMYNKAAVTNAATPTVDYNTGKAFLPVPVGGSSVFVLSLDAAGVIRAQQGSVDPNGGIPQFPVIPDNTAPISYIVVNVGPTGAAWTFGASNLSGATGVTYSFQDVGGGLPDRPQAV